MRTALTTGKFGTIGVSLKANFTTRSLYTVVYFFPSRLKLSVFDLGTDELAGILVLIFLAASGFPSNVTVPAT
jgi:hypothetical protein